MNQFTDNYKQMIDERLQCKCSDDSGITSPMVGMFSSGSSNSSDSVKQVVRDYFEDKFKQLTDLEKEIWTLCYHHHKGNCLNGVRYDELLHEHPVLFMKTFAEVRDSSVEFLEAKWKSIKGK